MNSKSDRAWLKEHKDALPPEELANERGARAGHVGGSRNSSTRDAKALALAAEHAEAARDILSHPSLTDREREVWGYYVDGLRDLELLAAAKIDKTNANKIIARVKALMLAPGDAGPPPKDEKAATIDLEDTIELGARNAHRVIEDIHKRASTDVEDVENNERAVRTILAIRKSEWEYHFRSKPASGASDDEVRRVAGSERV